MGTFGFVSDRAQTMSKYGQTGPVIGAGECQSEAPRELSPAAQRALAEAAERRARREQEAKEQAAQAELGGRAGPDPVRYGDWENGGIASDF